MGAELDIYRQCKDRIVSLLGVSDLCPQDSRYMKRYRLDVLALAVLNKMGFVCVVSDFAAANYCQKTNASIAETDCVYSLVPIVTQMDEVVRVYFRDYKNMIVSLLQISGLWPDDVRQSRRAVPAACSFAVIGLAIFGVVNYMVNSAQTIMSLVSVTGLLLSFSMTYVKMLTMVLLWRDLRQLNDGLTSLFESDLQVPEYRFHLLALYPAFCRFFKTHCYFSVCFVAFHSGLPLVAALHGNYVRTYAIRMPFDYTPGGPLHWLIYAYEVLVGMYMAIMGSSLDSVLGMYALQMAGELRLLSHRFRGLRADTNYRRELKDCVDRHCLLIDGKHLIERVSGFMSASVAFSCTIGICSLIYQLTQAKNVPLFKLIIAIDYIGIKFLQAYTYAWFGNTITVESERCVESIYFSRWFESGNVQLMKDLLIIRSQSPMYINALGFMMVRLDMFIKIVHASISYFFMVKTMEEKVALAD